jgi:hypothetical protein
VQATDPALSNGADAVAHGPKSSRLGERATRKSSRRANGSETVELVQTSLGLPVNFDGVSLDEEIRLLRDPLARKRQLQNAQLKRMLERLKR